MPFALFLQNTPDAEQIQKMMFAFVPIFLIMMLVGGRSILSGRMTIGDFLMYAYLQIGQDDKARATEQEAVAMKNEGYGQGREAFYYYVQAHFPAMLERTPQ